MAISLDNFYRIKKELQDKDVALVAVSKTKPVSDILELYGAGHRDFGENYVQELTEKAPQLPPDVRWHFIGHLQTNKVKYIAPFVHLIHGVDSEKLLREINKQGAKNNRRIPVLLQVHIAAEETKFGFDAAELKQLLQPGLLNSLPHVLIKGMMGMASFTDQEEIVQQEFKGLKALYDTYKKEPLPNTDLSILSMGMSNDYKTAIVCGSTMVRIGSLLFGARNYPQ